VSLEIRQSLWHYDHRAELAEMLMRRHIVATRQSRAELFPANVETARARHRAR